MPPRLTAVRTPKVIEVLQEIADAGGGGAYVRRMVEQARRDPRVALSLQQELAHPARAPWVSRELKERLRGAQ